MRADSFVSSAAVLFAIACSTPSEPANTPLGTGGASPTGGAPATTGGLSSVSTGGTPSTGTGGVSTGGAATGGLSSGGSATGGLSTSSGGQTTGGLASSNGGSTPSAGAGNGGSAGSTGGSAALGGASTGGSGGKASGGSAGTLATGGAGGGGTAQPTPSTGCGKSSGKPTSANVANTIVTFPDGYDGSTPMPLVFGFHGAGRTNEQFRTVDAKTQGGDIEKQYVMAYLKAAGSGWVVGADTTRLNAALDTLSSTYCIDTSRVFATGHSSGAQFIVQLLCAGNRKFRGVAPVASSVYCQKWTAIPTLLIHGKNDTERAGDADGRKDLAPYVASNACTMNSTPLAAACSSAASVTPGCVEYQGCTQPLLWCNHDDPNYSNTNHGWPCFANKSIFDFFQTLK